ncbi:MULTISPECIES: cobalt ECF transporter T component CbiQ [Paenibacillus]|uniref:Cobalt ECF transporter T component CbiQ n=1 Tax=Paenibacillus borealis TaxID=160799 RepID=A0ABX3HAZ4_PAEBO|nr:cobalt ECF transporter T component CbiQ [Paenibacillus borealis]OMD46697.1 cobalt ECF transporter T component CbiQ [Paenibacillus borealis]
MIRRIDALSYSNALRQLPAMWKGLFAAVMFILSYALHPALQLVIAGWMTVWCVLYAKIPLRAYGLLFGTALLFFCLSLPALLLEIGHPTAGEALMSLQLPASTRSLYITAEGLHRAGLLLARVLACLTCCFFIIFTTPFGELLQVLRRLRMPQIVLELMLIMYRFLFLLSDTAHGMMLARRLRGGRRGRVAKLREVAGMAGSLFANTMHRYYGLSQGLITRGYMGEIILPPYVSRPVPRRFTVQACAGIFLLLLAQLWILRSW